MAPHGPDLLFPLALCSSWGAEKKEMETAVYIYIDIYTHIYNPVYVYRVLRIVCTKWLSLKLVICLRTFRCAACG